MGASITSIKIIKKTTKSRPQKKKQVLNTSHPNTTYTGTSCVSAAPAEAVLNSKYCAGFGSAAPAKAVLKSRTQLSRSKFSTMELMKH